MLQAIMNQSVLLYGVLVFSVLGGLTQVVLNSLYKKAIKDIANMTNPKSKLLRQIREKYRRFKQSNGNKITNLNIFIETTIMESKFLGMNLHTWRRCGGAFFVICAVLGVGGYYLAGTMNMAAQVRQNYLWSLLASIAFIAGVYGLTDISYKRKRLKAGLENNFINMQTESNSSDIEMIDKQPEPKQVPINTTMQSKRQRKKMVSSKAQRDKQELKENLARLKEGMNETAAEVERSKERNTEILKQMDSAEQERVIREVLKEFLS